MKKHSSLTATVAMVIAGLSSDRVAIAATDLWWDTAYTLRFNIAATVGANTPDKGYVGYTTRIASLDTQALVAAGDMQSDCSDMRITYYDGIAWQEMPRHVLNCNSPTTDIRFALVADIPAGGTDDNYYLYYGNNAPATPLTVTTTNVYLWYDDTASDRSASYIRGRIDNWHGNGWDNSLAWNAGGYYTYDNGDNFTSGYRRNVDERDVLIEAEFFHTDCYQLNISSGLLARGIIQSGTLGSESSNHYYASNRGEFPGCTTSGYNHDGDIVTGNRQTTAVDGTNPPDVIANVWRRQALAAWRVNPTNLSFWDEDTTTNWSALGFPGTSNLQVNGNDANDDEGRGFAAVITAQDDARLRNILIRRYTEPEPAILLSTELQPPTLVLQKNVLTVFDPFNQSTNPKAIPGSWVEYTITASNSGSGEVDGDTLVVTDPLPDNVVLFVGDLLGPGSGPVEFSDGVGSASSGLSYSYSSLADLSDNVEFSLNGVNFNYVPNPDTSGFDPAVRYIRVQPSGSFSGGSSGTPTTFSLRIRVKVQ